MLYVYIYIYICVCVCVCDRIRSVVPKFCSADHRGNATSSQGIRGYISVMATLNF